MLEHVKTTCFSCAFQLFTRCAGIAFLHLEETGLGNKQMVLLSASALTDPCVYHPSIHPSSCLIGSMLRHLWGHINQSQLADWGQLGRVTHGSAWSAKVLHGLFCLELQMLQGQTRKNWVMVILLYYIILYIYILDVDDSTIVYGIVVSIILYHIIMIIIYYLYIFILYQSFSLQRHLRIHWTVDCVDFHQHMR